MLGPSDGFCLGHSVVSGAGSWLSSDPGNPASGHPSGRQAGRGRGQERPLWGSTGWGAWDKKRKAVKVPRSPPLAHVGLGGRGSRNLVGRTVPGPTSVVCRQACLSLRCGRFALYGFPSCVCSVGVGPDGLQAPSFSSRLFLASGFSLPPVDRVALVKASPTLCLGRLRRSRA